MTNTDRVELFFRAKRKRRATRLRLVWPGNCPCTSGTIRARAEEVAPNVNKMAANQASGKPSITRYVVQRGTGRYIKDDGSWTVNREDARSFRDLASAKEFCTLHKVRDGDLLLNFGYTLNSDIRMPIK